ILAFPIILLGQPFSLDTTFQPDYPFLDFWDKNSIGIVSDLLEEPDGSMMVVGEFMQWPMTKRINIIRLKENGALDLSWNPSFWISEWVSYIQKAEGYYFFNGGNFGPLKTDFYGNLQNPDMGTLPLDSLFGGIPTKPYVFPDQSMIVGGDGSKYPNPQNFQRRLYFMRIKPNGFTDTSFYHNTNYVVAEVIRYDSTRLLLYGNQLAFYDSIPINKLCLIDTAGNLDTSFFAGSFTSGSPWPEYVQPDGKVIVAGRFTIKDHPGFLHLLRLNPDGSIDSTFNYANSVIGTQVNAVCPTTDGGLLIGGVFNTYQGYSRNNIVKTDSNGFIDLSYLNGPGIDSFNINWSQPGGVNAIVPAQNNKYYVMGHFLKYNGHVVKPLIRILGLSHTTTPLDEETDSEVSLTAYPNPTQDVIQFAWNLSAREVPAWLNIFDQKGTLINQKQINHLQGIWQWSSVSLPPGIYLYEFRTEKQVLLRQGKVIINH
ncbi:MAG: T9SS type A sorting domain-containing protein, partial [Bacteroidetes bacterium]|nr:T9SS type A sorting domain-containing protein [Bacteroidota bacterium]